MALFDDASLVTTPNGYKAGTLYSIKPTSGAGDMDVVRATTATRVNSAGLIESVANNVPRLDYSNGTCPSLLVEPQRTNLITYSSTFTNAIWTQDNSSLTSGFTSPSGAADAFKLIESATTAVHNIYITFLSLTLGNYTTSIYIKKGERFKVAIADRNSGVYVSYNLNTGTIIDSLLLVGTIESLDNDWYRLTATTSSSVSVYVPQFFILQDSYTTGIPITLPYLGDGTSGIYIWGAQLEEATYATSYIPTTSAAVTRNADAISKTGISSLIGQTEGTLFFDGIVNNIQNASSNIINTNKNPTTISSFSLIKINATNKINFEQYLGNGTFANIALVSTNAFANGIRTKVAVRYKSGNFAMYINGNLEATSSSTFTNIGVKSELFLNDAVTVFAFQESVSFNSVVLFPNILTNAELASLTTI